MLVAHLPAGYLLTRHILDRARPDIDLARRLLAVGVVAAVLPDLDLLYFYLVDNRQTLHRRYWPHLPLFWLGPAVACVLVCAWTRSNLHVLVFLVFFANILLHLLLDTVSGPVFWLFPFDRTGLVLVEVPARHGSWIWNLILHWSFGLELMVCLWALSVHARSRRQRPTAPATLNQ